MRFRFEGFPKLGRSTLLGSLQTTILYNPSFYSFHFILHVLLGFPCRNMAKLYSLGQGFDGFKLQQGIFVRIDWSSLELLREDR